MSCEQRLQPLPIARLPGRNSQVAIETDFTRFGRAEQIHRRPEGESAFQNRVSEEGPSLVELCGECEFIGARK